MVSSQEKDRELRSANELLLDPEFGMDMAIDEDGVLPATPKSGPKK